MRRSTAPTAWSTSLWSPSDGSGKPTLVKAAADLDRGVTAPHFTADGRAIDVIVADDRSAYPARIPLSGGTAQKLMQPPIVMNALDQLGGCSAAIVASDTRPNEILPSRTVPCAS